MKKLKMQFMTLQGMSSFIKDCGYPVHEYIKDSNELIVITDQDIEVPMRVNRGKVLEDMTATIDKDLWQSINSRDATKKQIRL